ncbi:FAS-associated death domain protein-like [Saccoglossus kowalevskii]
MLVTLCEKMGNDEFIKLKQRCHDVHIQKRTLETMNNAYDIFVCLKERGKITMDDTELLEELLEKIGRTDLVKVVEQYHQG